MNRNIVKNLVKCSVTLALFGFATAAAAKPMTLDSAKTPAYNQVEKDWYEGGNTATVTSKAAVPSETAIKSSMEATDHTRRMDMPMGESDLDAGLGSQDAGWYEGMNPATLGANRFRTQPLMESNVLPTDE